MGTGGLDKAYAMQGVGAGLGTRPENDSPVVIVIDSVPGCGKELLVNFGPKSPGRAPL